MCSREIETLYATSTSTAYGHQKTGSQGSLSTALVLANVIVVKTLLSKHECLKDVMCIACLVLACLSIMLQIAIGILLIILARNEHKHHAKKNKNVSRENTTEQCEDDKGNLKTEDQEDKQNKRKKRAKRMNFIILVLCFLVVVSNIALHGLYSS